MRFEEATEEAKGILQEVRSESFHELVNANILLLFDTKKRLSNGKIVLGRMQKTNDLLRHLTIDESHDEEGYDFIMFLDKVAFENTTKEDRVRIIRHELCHAFVDLEADKPYKLVPHDIEDFVEEIERNKDDVRWGERVADLTLTIYEQQSDMNAE